MEITEAGIEWWLTETWASIRPTAVDIWPNLTVLAALPTIIYPKADFFAILKILFVD